MWRGWLLGPRTAHALSLPAGWGCPHPWLAALPSGRPCSVCQHVAPTPHLPLGCGVHPCSLGPPPTFLPREVMYRSGAGQAASGLVLQLRGHETEPALREPVVWSERLCKLQQFPEGMPWGGQCTAAGTAGHGRLPFCAVCRVPQPRLRPMAGRSFYAP